MTFELKIFIFYFKILDDHLSPTKSLYYDTNRLKFIDDFHITMTRRNL